MPFRKIFGALKEMGGDISHGMVKQGALKNPIEYRMVEHGVGLAKKTPFLNSATGGISDWFFLRYSW